MCIGFVQDAPASDLNKEKRWREQIIDAILDGEPVDLNNGRHDFLAIYTEGDGSRETGLIIMHGIGIHPDYPSVVNPLRVGLTEKGWSTLSLQLPVLPNEATGEDYGPLIPQAASRIQAGIEHLKQAGLKRVVIVAHSLGTIMAGHALANNTVEISGFVAIGMGAGGARYLKSIQVPILDLYGSNDQPGVIGSAQLRQSAAASNRDYTQIAAKDADHFFNDQEDELIRLIANWLDTRAK
ncbi:MAG: alpha/beta hydrolase family protein [Gammaproteobacteria bacterium]|nr:alpha/beta hydrolase family protein [Gammaproteobacteria bacterium]